MTHRAVRRLHGEDGASLVLAMAFLILFGLILVALLGFAVTSFKAGGDVGDREKATYAADAAIDTAVARMRQDAGMQTGRNASYTGSQPCGLTYHPTDGTPDATATCNPQTTSGAVLPGIDGPANTILTRAGGLTATGGPLVTNGNVFVNGTQLTEQYIAATFRGKDNYGPKAVPEGTYFIMGDRRDSVSDSRHWGPVPRKYVWGRVLATVWHDR